MLVKCDGAGGCDEEFTTTGFKIKKIDNDIEKTYLRCPYCYKEFIAFYTDSLIRDKQAKIRKSKSIYEINKILKEIKNDMDSLRKQIEESN